MSDGPSVANPQPRLEDADNSEYPETIIIGRDSQFDHTEIISQLTGITNRTPDPVAESTVNVTIIIGKDYKNFKPYTILGSFLFWQSYLLSMWHC